MRPRRRTTFWRYNLFLEISALVLTAAILFLAVWFTLVEMNRKYLDLRLADAARVHLFLASRLDDAREGLVTFAELPETERAPAVLKLFSAFSDIYRLDQNRRVAQSYKAVPGSKVFAGFSFSGSKLADFLKSSSDRGNFSNIMRGYEDDAPSVYLALRRGSELYLGRLNLAYVQNFMAEFSRFAGTPVLLVANDGFVMLTGDPELHILAFDLKKWGGPPSVSDTLPAGHRYWIPIISETGVIGAHIVTLIPTELVETQRNALLVFLILFMGGLILLAVLKNHRLRRLIVQPMAVFAENMRDLETGQQPSAGEDIDYRFEELADIDTRFRTMAKAIRRREQSLKETTAQLAAASTAKSEFLAHMSHEIRTPMNAVLGLAQILNREPLTANQRDMIERIQAAGQSLLGIINDVLDFSKIEAGQLRLERRSFDLETLLAKLNSLMGPVAQAKGLALRVEPPAAPPGWLLGDALRLEQVLINLLGNAVKFTERGEVVVGVQLRETGETAVRLRFEVRDTGIGMAPEALARLFQPFTQAEAGITRRFGGTGLGLSICKRLVELMGGTIGANSQVGQGSTFWFELPFPRAAEGETEAPAVPTPPLPPGPRLTGLHLLVVDDNALNRDLVERMLALEGARVTLAADGQQALQHLKAQPEAFAAVLMDIQMPVLDGLSATRAIRSELGLTGLPVIALTAGVLAEQQQAAHDAGVNDFLAKPVDLEQMVATLLRWTCPPAPAAAVPLTVLATPAPAPGAADQNRSAGLPEIPGFDAQQAALTFRDDREFFLELLGMFCASFRDTAQEVRADLATGARDAAARRLHTLKGTAGNLGALELMHSAQALERAIFDGEPEVEPRLEQFTTQLADLMQAVAPWLRERAGAPPLGPGSTGGSSNSKFENSFNN